MRVSSVHALVAPATCWHGRPAVGLARTPNPRQPALLARPLQGAAQRGALPSRPARLLNAGLLAAASVHLWTLLPLVAREWGRAAAAGAAAAVATANGAGAAVAVLKSPASRRQKRSGRHRFASSSAFTLPVLPSPCAAGGEYGWAMVANASTWALAGLASAAGLLASAAGGAGGAAAEGVAETGAAAAVKED